MLMVDIQTAIRKQLGLKPKTAGTPNEAAQSATSAANSLTGYDGRLRICSRKINRSTPLPRAYSK
jgi:hypothetical protein